MPKSWKILPKTSKDIVSQLLLNRGITSQKEKERFLSPKLEDYIKDLEIPGIEKARKRVLKAVENKELIIIYGDYDVDGVCGTAVLYHGLTAIGAKVLPYIPHREKEGYGLSYEGLKIVKEKGAGLVITVDNGVVAFEQAKFAKSLGLELIITDHHVALEDKPECFAIVHSTKMCGAAVGWCLIRSLVLNQEAEGLLDLVGIATICDLVPLLKVNRALAKIGIEKLNQTKRVGLLALFYESKVTAGKITAYHISHLIGPRLNAIGRLEHAIDSVRLLCTKDSLKAKNLARLLCQANDQKKQLAQDAVVQAKEMIAQEAGIHHDETYKNKKVLVLYSKGWIPGIIGLVAARVAEEYHLPTVVLSKGERQSKGSARSVNGVNIVDIIRKCSDLLLDVGGHPRAAGFTIETDKIEKFKSRLEKLVAELIFEDVDKLEIEAEVKLSEINKELVEKLDQFEPTGVGNLRPVLVTKNMRISDIKTVGEGKHLKFKVLDSEQCRRTGGVEAIAFSFGSLAKLLSEGQLLSVVYYLEIDEFNGSQKLQLKVLDIQY